MRCARLVDLGALLTYIAIVGTGCKGTATPVETVPAVCDQRFITLTVGPPAESSSQFTTTLRLTNTSEKPCTFLSAAGVRLREAASAAVRPECWLRWQGEDENGRIDSSPLRLEPGRSAGATLTFLRGSDIASSDVLWTPSQVDVELGPSAHVTAPWQWGDVVCMDGATHPGTYVSAFALEPPPA